MLAVKVLRDYDLLSFIPVQESPCVCAQALLKSTGSQYKLNVKNLLRAFLNRDLCLLHLVQSTHEILVSEFFSTRIEKVCFVH